MDVQFQDVVFKVDKPWLFKDGGRTILKGLSGKFSSGQLSAILGPSGAGKSSLLNAISGYRSAGVSGELCINGERRDEKRFRRLSCFIAQEDVLQPLLTLHELMMLVASLKLPPHTTSKQRHATVCETQKLLGLENCQNTMTDSLSGGQKKRLSIALELINNPPVVFLDEPTSGLDNVSASNLIKLLKELAHGGRTIVCTIHQPSASLFALFDHIYVVSSGLCVYQGTTTELVPFLSSVGLHCPTHYNPADYIIEMTDKDCDENIEVLSTATRNGKLTCKNKTPELTFTSSPTEPVSDSCREQQTDSLLKYETQLDVSCMKTICAELNASSWRQFCFLLWRMTLQIRRNRLGLKIQLYHHLGCGLAIGVVFWGLAQDGDQFFNHMKFCMGIILFHAYTHIMVPVLAFPYEVKLLKKEHFNQWYGLGPYYLALTFAKVPTISFFSIIFLTMVYLMSGLPLEIHRFIVFCTIGITVSFAAEGMGLAIGSIFSVTNGAAVGPMSLAPFLGFAIYGFDFAREIPWWMWPFLKTSFLRSGVIALIIAVFGMDRGMLNCHHPMYCHFRDPKVTIHYLDLDHVSAWAEIGLLILIMVTFRFACFVGLRWRLRT